VQIFALNEHNVSLWFVVLLLFSDTSSLCRLAGGQSSIWRGPTFEKALPSFKDYAQDQGYRPAFGVKSRGL